MIKASHLHPISVAFAAWVHLRTLRPSDEVESKHRGRKKRAYRLLFRTYFPVPLSPKAPGDFFRREARPREGCFGIDTKRRGWLLDNRRKRFSPMSRLVARVLTDVRR